MDNVLFLDQLCRYNKLEERDENPNFLEKRTNRISEQSHQSRQTNLDQQAPIYHEDNKVSVVIDEIYTINFVPEMTKRSIEFS